VRGQLSSGGDHGVLINPGGNHGWLDSAGAQGCESGGRGGGEE
jgi:hypothetical protein